MNIKSVLILVLLSLWSSPFLSQGTTLVNQGAFFHSMPGFFVRVNVKIENDSYQDPKVNSKFSLLNNFVGFKINTNV